MAVIIDWPLEYSKKISEEYKFSSLVLNDKEGSVIKSYKVNDFPFTNLIDENNILMSKGFVNNIDDLENLLNTTK